MYHQMYHLQNHPYLLLNHPMYHRRKYRLYQHQYDPMYHQYQHQYHPMYHWYQRPYRLDNRPAGRGRCRCNLCCR